MNQKPYGWFTLRYKKLYNDGYQQDIYND